MGRNGRTFSGNEEHLCSGQGASRAAPATWEPHSEQVTGLDPSPGTPAAISLHGTAQGRAWGWKSCTTVKCDRAVPQGGSVGRAGIGSAAP